MVSGGLVGVQAGLVAFVSGFITGAGHGWLEHLTPGPLDAAVLGTTLVLGGALIGAGIGTVAYCGRTGAPAESVASAAAAERDFSAACYAACFAAVAATASLQGRLTWLTVVLLATIMIALGSRWRASAAPLHQRVAPISLGVASGAALLLAGLPLRGHLPSTGLRVAAAGAVVIGSFVLGFLVMSLFGREGLRRAVSGAEPVVAALLLVGAVAWGVQRADAFEAYLGQIRRESATGPVTTPNIVLISLDALRYDYLGHAGGPARTPNLDAFAARSWSFTRAHSVAPWTRPSVASMLSGRYPSEVGLARVVGGGEADMLPHEWRDDQPLLPVLLRQAGYTTAAVLTNPYLRYGYGAERGFDHFFHSDSQATTSAHLERVNELLPGSLVPSFDDLERADHVTPWAQQALAGLRGRSPFFFWAHYMDPHAPYDAPGRPPHYPGRMDLFGAMAGSMLRSSVSREAVRQDYIAEIEFLDTWLARLFESLRSDGLWDSSIIIICSDHGEEFWEHGSCRHGQSLFEELMHVPLMVHLPGQTEGHAVSQPASLLDIMPTTLELCEVPVLARARGRSLVPIFQGRGDELPPFRLFQEAVLYGGTRKAVLNDRYKLIHDLYTDELALYDLEKDPGELSNIWPQSASDPEAAKLRRELADWTAYSTELMRSAGQGPARSLDPAMRGRLRDLGYLD